MLKTFEAWLSVNFHECQASGCARRLTSSARKGSEAKA